MTLRPPFFLITLALSLATFPAWAGLRTYGTLTDVKFIRCYDGDTCTFTIPGVHPLFGEKISVRFRGIDTAEIKGKCPEENARAREAKKLVNQILSQTSRIDLVEVGRGKYFRILASVVADGKDLSYPDRQGSGCEI